MEIVGSPSPMYREPYTRPPSQPPPEPPPPEPPPPKPPPQSQFERSTLFYLPTDISPRLVCQLSDEDDDEKIFEVKEDRTVKSSLASSDSAELRYEEMNLKVLDDYLLPVTKITYLGTIFTKNNQCRATVIGRLGPAKRVFTELNYLWKRKQISLRRKLDFFKTLIYQFFFMELKLGI